MNKLTFKQIKYLLDHMKAKEDDIFEAEIVGVMDLRVTLTLYKHVETEEATPNDPISVNLHIYDDETVTDKDESIYYYAQLTGPDDSGEITYDQIEQLFHIDPDKPMWKVETDNSSFDEEDAQQCLEQMDPE